MYDLAVTRHYPGVNNEKESALFSDLYVAHRLGRVHEYPNDFDSYIAGDWTQTLNGGSVALAAGDGGILNLVTAVSASASIQDNPAAMSHTKSFRTWMFGRMAIDNLLGQVIFGLMNATATPFTPASITDGAWFSSAAGTGALSFNVAVGGVITTVAMGVSLVAGQQIQLSAYYDGAIYAAGQPNGRYVAQADQFIAGISSGAARVELGAAGTGQAGVMPATFPGATNLCYTIAAFASTAAARTLSIDTVYFAKDRININATPPF